VSPLKEFIGICIGIALAIFVGNLVLGAGTTSMKSQVTTMNTNYKTKVEEVSGW